MHPLPVSAAEFNRIGELLTLAMLAAAAETQIGDYLPFGEIVITFERGAPTNVRFERNYRPDKIEPPIEVKAE